MGVVLQNIFCYVVFIMLRIIVPGISENEQRNVRKKMSQIAASLAKHEGRDYWIDGTYIGEYTPVFIQERKFIVVPSPVFKHLLYDVLPTATLKYSESARNPN